MTLVGVDESGAGVGGHLDVSFKVVVWCYDVRYWGLLKEDVNGSVDFAAVQSANQAEPAGIKLVYPYGPNLDCHRGKR